MNTLAFRFDVDSVRCAEVGIPRLIEVADRLDVRFTFFLNMGYSFNWGHTLGHAVRKRLGRTDRSPVRTTPALGARSKLGIGGILKTMFLNPRLGDRYRTVFDRLHADGHELGLHGGTDHAVWQRSLPDLTEAGIVELLDPAYRKFESRYGKPRGFASPGFVYDDRVLRLMDRYEFVYASDMDGDLPFRPSPVEGYRHVQVPVNVMGGEHVPLVEQGLAEGRRSEEIIEEATRAIRGREFALMYGHPFVEGVHADLLERVIEGVRDTHEVVTVEEYLGRWQARGG